MLIHPRAFQVARVAPKEDARYALPYVHLTPAGVATSTNGASLLRYIPSAEQVVTEDQFPPIPSQPEGADDPLVAPVLIPVETAAKLARHKGLKGFPGLAYVQLHGRATNENKHVRLMATDLESPQVTDTCKPQDVDFPNADNVIPEQAKEPVRFSIKLLTDLLSAMKAGGCSSVDISLHGDRNAARLDGTCDTGTYLGVIMPMRRG